MTQAAASDHSYRSSGPALWDEWALSGFPMKQAATSGQSKRSMRSAAWDENCMQMVSDGDGVSLMTRRGTSLTAIS